MTPSSFFRSSMLLSSTAKAATRTFTANQTYASISRRTISSTRPFLSVNENQDQSPVPSQSPSPSPSTPTQKTTQQQKTASTDNAENETATATLPSEPNANTINSLNQSPPSLRKYPYTLKIGTVTSVGLMDKTVRVAYRHREWDRHIRKYYPKTTTYLVSDPRNSLREGDVIEFSSGAPRSPRVRHVVERIIAPFGVEISDRPPVMTREEREAERMQKRAEKLARKAGRVAASASAAGDQDVEAITRRFLQSKDHIGRIRSLVLERTSQAEASAPASA